MAACKLMINIHEASFSFTTSNFRALSGLVLPLAKYLYKSPIYGFEEAASFDFRQCV